MAKRSSVYLHRAAFLPVRLPFEVVTGAAVMPHPARGARKEREREAAILAALVPRHMGRIRHRAFDRRGGEFFLMAERDERAAAVWFFDLDAKGGAEIFELKVLRIITIPRLS